MVGALLSKDIVKSIVQVNDWAGALEVCLLSSALCPLLHTKAQATAVAPRARATVTAPKAQATAIALQISGHGVALQISGHGVALQISGHDVALQIAGHDVCFKHHGVAHSHSRSQPTKSAPNIAVAVVALLQIGSKAWFEVLIDEALLWDGNALLSISQALLLQKPLDRSSTDITVGGFVQHPKQPLHGCISGEKKSMSPSHDGPMLLLIQNICDEFEDLQEKSQVEEAIPHDPAITQSQCVGDAAASSCHYAPPYPIPPMTTPNSRACDFPMAYPAQALVQTSSDETELSISEREKGNSLALGFAERKSKMESRENQ
nr:hypothetical protein Itr_chr14CG09570 [Ipomoea trifida]